MPDVAAFILALSAVTIVTVTVIMWVVARMSGWRSLAQRFPAQPPAPDADRGLGSLAFMTIGGYNNCIFWRADDDHLHLRVMVPFNMFHKPLSIPWAHIEIDNPGGRWGMAAVRMDGRRYGVPSRAVAREATVRAAMAAMESGSADEPAVL